MAASLGYGFQLARFVGFALLKRRQQRVDQEWVTQTLFKRPPSVGGSASRPHSGARGGMDKRDTEEMHGRGAMRDAEFYLSQQGVPTGLPPLEIRYSAHGAKEKTHVITAGECLSSRCDSFLQLAPVVRWDNVQDAMRPHAVLLIDPDAPAPGPRTHRHLPGAFGPWLHAIWTDCHDGSTAGASFQAVPYHGPSPPMGVHRYIFVLLEQTGTAPAVKVNSTCRKRWDLRQFLVDNPHLKPKAVNYFYAGKEKP